MVSQALDLLIGPIGVERLDGLYNPGVECAPPILEHARVGDLVGEGVLEGVFEIREDARLVEQLGRLEAGEPAVHASLRDIGDGLQQCERHILPDDGGRLKESFVLGWQPVDTGGEDRLSRRWDLPCLGRLRHPISPAITDQHVGLHQDLHRLLEKEGVAFGPLGQDALEGLEASS